MEDLLSKVLVDLNILIDTHGQDSVLNALADIAGIDGHKNMLAERKGASSQALAKAIFDLLVRSAGGTAKLATKPAAAAIDKALDQDVHISSQGPVLKVTDQGLYQLVAQTNELIRRTHELLMGAEEAINTSTKELEDVNVSIDDLIGTETGELASDVAIRQGSGVGAKKQSDVALDDEEEDAPPPARL